MLKSVQYDYRIGVIDVARYMNWPKTKFDNDVVEFSNLGESPNTILRLKKKII